mgnify:CR=1 FL=1
MDFTFGIITTGNINSKVLSSIYKQQIPNFEIIVVGGSPIIGYSNLTHIPFNENIKKGWISKKKNIISEHAKYENIVFMHDYFYLNDNWYEGFKKFGNNWEICMNLIKNQDGTRFRDWCIWDDPELCFPGGGYPATAGNNGHSVILPSYDYNKYQFMYISGGYWVSKKHVMIKYPLNESLCWGEGEDIEWSKRVLTKFKYKMNENSSVQILKLKRLSANYL